MGMYDTISISDQLPFTDEMKELGLDKNNHDWQTKNLGGYFGSFFIQNGELFEQEYKKISHKEGDPNGNSIMDRVGYIERSEPFLKKIDFHGEIYFYNYVSDVQDKWDCWIEFKATFSHGKVEKIELIKFNKTDVEERKKREREFWLEADKERNLWYNKYIFYTKIGRFIRIKWTVFCFKIANFFQKIA